MEAIEYDIKQSIQLENKKRCIDIKKVMTFKDLQVKLLTDKAKTKGK